MIEYIVASLPRSGSAWLAALLSTDEIPCLHEPLAKQTLAQLDNMPKSVGICDTSIFLNPEAINFIQRPTAVLMRDFSEIEASLNNYGMSMPVESMETIYEVRGPRISYGEMFSDYSRIAGIYKHLTKRHLSKRRWEQFKDFRIENHAMTNLCQQIFAEIYAECSDARLH